MRRRLGKRGLVALGVVLVPLAAGILYAASTGRNSSGIEANRRALASAGAYPGAREVGRVTASAIPDDSLPVPRRLVTAVAYAPPPGTTQLEVVDFYLERLRGAWTPQVERPDAGNGERAFRLTFSRDGRCLELRTTTMLESLGEQRVYTLSAYPGDDC